jgi:hypothetical protein
VRSTHAHSACVARGHAGARPTATRARPALAGPASTGAARAAHGVCVVHGTCARWLCSAALPGEPVAARHRRTGDGGGDGSSARRRRRATVTGDGGCGEAAGCGPGDAASDRGGRGVSCQDDGGAREARVGRRCRKRRGEREARGTSGRGVRGDAVGTSGARSR